MANETVLLDLRPRQGAITEMHVWLAVQTDGSGEGIMSAMVGDMHIPLLSSEAHIADSLASFAHIIEKMSNGKVRAERRVFRAVAH